MATTPSCASAAPPFWGSKMRRKLKLSPTSALHYAKLVFRSGLLLAALVLYVVNRVRGTGRLFGRVENDPIILMVIWLVFVVEMIFRFFPARIESMGCQKQFRANYRPSGAEKPAGLHRGVRLTVVSWVVLNGAVGAAHFLGWLDTGVLLLISLAYSVCDMVCILFFCPFQTWFMKNKCCTTCRIYNWDYAMMFTPLIFVPSWYCLSLVLIAFALLVQWEVLIYRHPERFSEATNCTLACANCKEKLCSHKKQLRRFWQKNREQLLRVGHQIRQRESHRR